MFNLKELRLPREEVSFSSLETEYSGVTGRRCGFFFGRCSFFSKAYSIFFLLFKHYRIV